MGEGNKKLSKRDPQSQPRPLPRRGLPARRPAELPGAARLVAGGGPRVLLADRDGDAVRRLARAAQPGALRPQEVPGDQRRRIRAHRRRRTWRAGSCRTCRRTGSSPAEPTAEQLAVVDAAVPLVQERMETLVDGARNARLPARATRPRSSSTRTTRAKALGAEAPSGAAGRVRRAGRPRAVGPRRRSRRRCGRRSSRVSASSPSSRSARCGSRSPAGGSRRRCSSRSSCWAGRGRSTGCAARWTRPRLSARAAADWAGTADPLRSTGAGPRGRRHHGVWGNWQPD